MHLTISDAREPRMNVAQPTRRAPRRWTMPEYKRAFALKAEGYKYRQIGKRLGRSVNCVNSFFKRYRMTPEQKAAQARRVQKWRRLHPDAPCLKRNHH